MNYTPLKGWMLSAVEMKIDQDLFRISIEKLKLSREIKMLKEEIRLRKQLWPRKVEDVDYSGASDDYAFDVTGGNR